MRRAPAARPIPLHRERPAEATREVPLLLNVVETADLLRTTPAAVYVMASRQQLPGVTRIGKRLLVRADDLLQWLDQKRAPSPRSER